MECGERRACSVYAVSTSRQPAAASNGPRVERACLKNLASLPSGTDGRALCIPLEMVLVLRSVQRCSEESEEEDEGILR